MVHRSPIIMAILFLIEHVSRISRTMVRLEINIHFFISLEIYDIFIINQNVFGLDANTGKFFISH